MNNQTGSAATPAATPSPAIAVLRDVHFAVDSGKHVFSGLDIEIRRGAVTAIMGPSGTGKTTLLKLITGQVCPPTAGRSWWTASTWPS